MNILFVDNFDSFTWNLVDEFARRGHHVEVWRNDVGASHILERAAKDQALIVLSPGPGAPADAGCCVELVQRAPASTPILGVCLGHQAIVEAYGGVVGPAGEIVHGKSSPIELEAHPLFDGMHVPFRVGRYHSLSAETMPDTLNVIARHGDMIMAVAHPDRPVAGVQFHPESVLTPEGGLLLENMIRWAAAAQTETSTTGGVRA